MARVDALCPAGVAQARPMTAKTKWPSTGHPPLPTLTAATAVSAGFRGCRCGTTSRPSHARSVLLQRIPEAPRRHSRAHQSSRMERFRARRGAVRDDRPDVRNRSKGSSQFDVRADFRFDPIASKEVAARRAPTRLFLGASDRVDGRTQRRRQNGGGDSTLDGVSLIACRV